MTPDQYPIPSQSEVPVQGISPADYAEMYPGPLEERGLQTQQIEPGASVSYEMAKMEQIGDTHSPKAVIVAANVPYAVSVSKEGYAVVAYAGREHDAPAGDRPVARAMLLPTEVHRGDTPKLIGRNNKTALREDRMVSGDHFSVGLGDDGRLVITDLSSTNGTRVITRQEKSPNAEQSGLPRTAGRTAIAGL